MGDDRRQPTIEELVEAHHATLYRYALRLTGSVADAEDLTQQTFLVAQSQLGELRDQQASRAWLMAILRNCYLRERRRRRPMSETGLDLSLDWFPEKDEPGEEIDGELLQAALDELPEPFRIVLLLYYFENLSYREIATQLGLPPGTVMSRLSRAKSHLRRRLQPHRIAVAGSQRHGWMGEHD